MLIQIIENGSKKIIAIVPILSAPNGEPVSKEQAFELAWKVAKDDGLIKSQKREDHEFSVVG